MNVVFLEFFFEKVWKSLFFKAEFCQNIFNIFARPCVCIVCKYVYLPTPAPFLNWAQTPLQSFLSPLFSDYCIIWKLANFNTIFGENIEILAGKEIILHNDVGICKFANRFMYMYIQTFEQELNTSMLNCYIIVPWISILNLNININIPTYFNADIISSIHTLREIMCNQ